MKSHSHSNPPGWAYALTFVGGSLTLVPWLSCWKSPWSRIGVGIHALLPWLFPFFLPINWLFVAAFWLGWNGIFGFLLLSMKPPLRQFGRNGSRFIALRRGVGASLALFPLGFMLVALEQFISDKLWSSFYPVNASLDSISFEISTLWVNFGILLLFVGIHAARSEERFTPLRLFALAGFSFVGYFLISQLFLGLMAIPAWQLMEREVFPQKIEFMRQLLYYVQTFIALPLLTATAYRLWLQRQSFIMYWSRSLASLILALVGLSFASGMPIYYALLMGMQQEKEARPQQAIPWYGHALTWSRSDKLNSYLQFHMGLLWRKQGRIDLAHDAFLRVLVNYPHDNDLLVMAHEFRARLETDSAKKAARHVISGIEARTEYKNAYCVPNSLGLVLNYWGDRTGAKTIGAEITQLDQGSFITDAVHFAERRGFRALVLPLREIPDLFKLVDHGFPVLTFIPGHVLAIFGYDLALQTLVTYDVNTVDIWDEQRWSVFQRDWNKQFNTLAVIVPENKLKEAETLLGPHALATSEAYIQYLLGGLAEEDVDVQTQYFKRAKGHGLFFSAWELEQLLGEGQYSHSEDKAAQHFLLSHSVTETELLAYLRSLYSTGHCQEALSFLEDFKRENTLEQSMQLVRAGCLNQMGFSDSSALVLANETETKSLPSPLLRFLLSEPTISEDLDLEKTIAGDALGQEDGLDGETAHLALNAFLETLANGPTEAEAAIDVLEGYVTRTNPYDTLALMALEKLVPLKRFKPEEDLEREGFLKRMELLHQRRLSLGR